MTLLVFNIVTSLGFFLQLEKTNSNNVTYCRALFFLFENNLDSWRDK